MLRRRINATAQLTPTLGSGSTAAANGITALAPSRRTFFKPTLPCALVYTPPGSGRDNTGALPWYQHRPQQQLQPMANTTTTTAPAAPTPVAAAPAAAVAPNHHHNHQQQASAPAPSLPPPIPAQARRGIAQSTNATTTPNSNGLAGPSLDTRIQDIIKVEGDLSAELLPTVVQLLIDPTAVGVERITLSDFVAMQPRRQLMALGGRRPWLEFILNSPYYQQVSRLAADSPAHDLRALSQAGITSLYQWAEKPSLVQVSARTRSALDGAVEQSVQAYMQEVASLVNTSGQLEPLLNSWVSDVVGKFVLDSLKISVESASAALWRRRGAAEATSTTAGGGGCASGNRGGVGISALSAMWDSPAENRSGATPNTSTGPVLRPGEACTLEHYYHFTQKVLSSVRQDHRQRHANMAGDGGGGSHGKNNRGASSSYFSDAQTEAEIAARTHTVISSALAQLLDQAVAQHLPAELRPLYASGYVALDRMPALLRRAVSFMQLRSIPVRQFVLHTTVGATTTATTSSSDGGNNNGGMSAVEAAAAMSGQLNVAAPSFGPGTFLTGSAQSEVTLGEWSGAADPPSSSGEHDPVHLEYLSILRRVQKHLNRLSMTPLLDVVANAEAYGAHGFAAFEAVGLDQLFGHAKLIEDRLVSVLSYPPATAQKPMHFIESANTSGKTALLERLSARTRAGERAVIVRYSGTSTPFVPDLDDNPIAFPARFWFRVALASCPFLIRTEELYSRAPRSVMWWGNDKNWSWESYQSLIASANHVGHRVVPLSGGRNNRTGNEQLATILVDDMDRLLDSMEAKWSLRGAAASKAAYGGGGDIATAAGNNSSAIRREMDAYDEEEELEAEGADSNTNADGTTTNSSSNDAEREAARARRRGERQMLATLTDAEERQIALGVWKATGKTIPELLSRAFAKVTVALGQVDLVFTGQRVSPILEHYAQAPVRRYFIPVSNGVGLQQRMRVLPLLSVLHALHLRSQLEMPGLLYEVLKNCPALTGKTIETFWSGRIAQLDLRATPSSSGNGGGGRLLIGGGSGGGDGPVLHSYSPRELYVELPLRNSLLRHPRRNRLRLVELLQRQLSSPTGFLSTGIDTDAGDVASGLVAPHSHTTSQVHPFALLTIFSHQDALESSAAPGGNNSSSSGNGTSANNASSSSASGNSDALMPPPGKEKKVVRAWAEVWSEYRAVVHDLATTPTRKRDAMRVLLHGALLLRSAAVAGANLDLNLKVPNYGFPLLSSEVRMKGRHVVQPIVAGAEVRPATADTVRKATAAYKSFFSNATQSHFPFRPMVGLNGGCDVVCVSGTTLGLYDIVTTMEELHDVPFRFAEALVGVLHLLEKQVVPVDKVKQVQYVSVVSIDQANSPSNNNINNSRGSRLHSLVAGTAAAASSGGGGGGDGSLLAAAAIPYLLDLSALFEDNVLDRLRAIQEPLGITKEFRTLHDLLDELERRFGVRVRQEIAASQEELEALLSPTLLQLVPDATVLPPYTQTVVSAERLMMEALVGGGGVGGGASSPSASHRNNSAHVDTEELLANAANDNDDDIIIGNDYNAGGAEADDFNADKALAAAAGAGDKDSDGIAAAARDVLLADSEAHHESAELLAAMMNDGLGDNDNDNDNAADAGHREAMANTARELNSDLAMENRINHGVPAAPASSMPSATAAGGAATPSPPPVKTPGRELDSLAWLHDIITPDSLLASPPSAAASHHSHHPHSPATPASAGMAAAMMTTMSGSGGGGGGGLAGPGYGGGSAGGSGSGAKAHGSTALTSGLMEDDDDIIEGIEDGEEEADENDDDAEAAGWREALTAGGVDNDGEEEEEGGSDGRRRRRGVSSRSASNRTASKKPKHAAALKGRGGGGVEVVSLAQMLDKVGSRMSKARRAAAGSKKRKKAAGGGQGNTAAAAAAKKRKAGAAATKKAGKKPAPKKKGGKKK